MFEGDESLVQFSLKRKSGFSIRARKKQHDGKFPGCTGLKIRPPLFWVIGDTDLDAAGRLANEVDIGGHILA